jgi:hypothetical protein
MAATLPFKAQDLIRKYGWDILPYLSNLGVNLLAEAQVLFVDSGATNALDADDAVHGHSFDKPLATLDYAIGLCTASQGDVILVAPGHAETLSGASDLDIDVDGITIIGIGNGTLKPTFSLGGTDGLTTAEINGDNIRVSNLRFVGADEDGTTVCIDIKTGSDYVTLEGLEFFETVNTKEILKCITIEDGVDQLTIKNCVFRNLCSGDNTAAVATEGDEHDFLVVDGCTFIGDWTAGILDLDADTIQYPLIKDCVMVNHDTAAGKAVLIGASTKAVMVNLRVASAKANGYPASNISASYQMGCEGCEPGKETVAYMGGATATSWAS